MSYYFNAVLKNCTMAEAREKVTRELGSFGFGIISEINISETLKAKIDVDFKPYIILGACNPQHAYNALKEEDKIGLFLPCNIVISEEKDGSAQVSVIDPIEAMAGVNNKNLADFAEEVRQSMSSVIKNLS